MLVTHAPPRWIKPLVLDGILSSLSPRIVSHRLTQAIKLLNSHYRRSSCRTVAMATPKVDSSGESLSEHATGKWYSVQDLRLRDHRFTVPLNYRDPATSLKISIFAREVVAVGKEDQAMPYLLFLQGGPGFESPRPTEGSGWILKACEEFRRGTGLSTPLTTSSMLQFKSARDLADYLKHFRADSIVNDAEFIRVRLVPGTWTVLGQVARQNEKYYKRYPQDIEVVREVVNYLAESEGGGVPLPSGGILTPRGLQLLGLSGLGSSAGFERLHYLFERVWDPVIVPGAPKKISFYFLNAFDNWLGFDSNPLYALIYESIYCQGASSRWSAQRLRAKYENKFDAMKAAGGGPCTFYRGDQRKPTSLEANIFGFPFTLHCSKIKYCSSATKSMKPKFQYMMFPWMFDEIHALKHFKDAAHLLAEKEDWPALYDKAALNNNKVPVAAAIYFEDMYVNFNLVMQTVSEIAGIRTWITNEYMHSGLRDAGGQVFDHLMGMLSGKRPLF
ncbi:hypothetical protein SLEP1_g57585 [Rubroshorea leprosula]|uniref:Proline iminopeptidase n=1 Tax=Rubroshorea leprosula TaxID=152421 RepID=A0AAV5MQ98_9ROSI|nr:hypothetical protein SLEP1_g57585 [Rubroshorea leprosula]